MFFETVKLRRDGWYCKLQRAMFGIEPTFENFCPFFWLTVFCVIASPFFFGAKCLGKGLVASFGLVMMAVMKMEKPIETLFNAMVKAAEFMDSFVCIPVEREFLKGLDDRQIDWYYRHSRDAAAKEYGMSDAGRAWKFRLEYTDPSKHRLWARLDRKFQIWKALVGESWQDQLKAARERLEASRKDEYARLVREREASERRAADREASRRRTLNAIVKWTRWVVPVLVVVVGVPLAACLAYWLGIGLWGALKFLAGFLVFVFYTVPAVLFRTARDFYGECSRADLLTMALAPVVGMGLMALNKKCDLEVPTEKAGEILRTVVLWIAVPFIRFGEFASEFGSFFVEFFKTFKKNHCPHIEWVD